MGQGLEKLKVKSYPDRKQHDHIERLKILVIFDGPRWTMTLSNLVNSLTTSLYKAEKYLNLPTSQEK